MVRNSVRTVLRTVAAPLLMLAAILLVSATPGSAASYNLAFTGTVTSTTGIGGGVFKALGIVVGDAVSGTFTLDPFVTTPDAPPSGGNSGFTQPSVSYTFHVSHPAKVDLTYSDAGSGLAVAAGDPVAKSGIRFTLNGADSTLEVTHETDPTGGPLASLVGLPTTSEGLIALFGGTSPHAYGNFVLKGFGQVGFDIALAKTALAKTPIPAALPLFAAALGGLGFVGWRRRAHPGSPGATA